MAERGAVVKAAVLSGLDKALSLQQGQVVNHVRKMRRSRPDAAPAEIVAALERHYLATVAGLGAAAGGPAAMPGVGTAVSLALAGGEVVGVIDVTALFALAVAEVHGVTINDLERRRTLVLAVLLGQSASGVIEQAAGRTGKYWGRNIVRAIPMTVIDEINKKLGPRFVTKWGTKQGILVLGREVPFGLGMAIGGGGNYLVGRSSIRAARKAFGPPPHDWTTMSAPKPPVDLAAGVVPAAELASERHGSAPSVGAD
jgi:hypothetical protein